MAEPTPSLREILELTRRLSAIHRELGIPASYAIDRRLEPHFEATPADLVTIGAHPVHGRPIQLLKPTADAWERMTRTAAGDRVTLIPISGFRSIERQAEIIRGKRAAGQSVDEILRTNAAPGFSEHHTGRALDLGTAGHLGLTEEFENTAAFRWLTQNAARFGFRLSYPRSNSSGIRYEPWHWGWSPLSD